MIRSMTIFTAIAAQPGYARRPAESARSRDGAPEGRGLADRSDSGRLCRQGLRPHLLEEILMSVSTPVPTETHPRSAEAASQIAMPFRGRWVRKVFVNALGLPRQHVYGALRAVKVSAHPRQVWKRRRIGRRLAAEQPGLAEWRERGYRILGPAELPGLENVVSICRSAFAELREAGPESYARNKRFLLSPLSGQKLCAHPDLVRFIVSEPLVRSASAYLGFVPVLAWAALWWSPAGSKPPYVRSQRYHSDHEDSTQLKLLVYIEDPGMIRSVHDSLAPRVDRIRERFEPAADGSTTTRSPRRGGDAPDVLSAVGTGSWSIRRLSPLRKPNRREQSLRADGAVPTLQRPRRVPAGSASGGRAGRRELEPAATSRSRSA
jgi:hypothetical protein